MEKIKTLPIINPCIPRVLPCNNCITLGICRADVSGIAEYLNNQRYESIHWTTFETKCYIIEHVIVPLIKKCSDLSYYLQLEGRNFPRDGWRLTNIYSVLSYLDMKLFCEFQKAVTIENDYRQMAARCKRKAIF